jgi:hypothetical protein
MVDGDTWVKTDSYVRTAMVALLIGLGTAVIYQSVTQGFLLDSVSAYYYTPAQGMFVGSLIGVAACMIALKGITEYEDVFLNLGGMFAAIVAIVPTSRGADFETAVRACTEAGGPPLTQRASAADCPTVEALADATLANVENNMVALLVVGGFGLVATVLLALRDRSPGGVRRVDTTAFRLGLVASALVWAGALVGVAAFERWFVDHAHFIAAAGLFLGIVAVGVANAVRKREEVGRPRRMVGYAWLVWVMVATGAVLGVLVLLDVTTLFWLEIVVAALFAVFWTVQAVEQLPKRA